MVYLPRGKRKASKDAITRPSGPKARAKHGIDPAWGATNDQSESGVRS